MVPKAIYEILNVEVQYMCQMLSPDGAMATKVL